MTTKRRTHDSEGDLITSAGVRLSDVPEFARHYVEWMDGMHGSAPDILPSQNEVPVPEVLSTLPELHPKRPRGSKAMIDAHGARHRLNGCRPGAWLISLYAGQKWAVWPSGEVGWVPMETELPDCLCVSNRNDLQ
jgi:hypothetical protein